MLLTTEWLPGGDREQQLELPLERYRVCRICHGYKPASKLKPYRPQGRWKGTTADERRAMGAVETLCLACHLEHYVLPSKRRPGAKERNAQSARKYRRRMQYAKLAARKYFNEMRLDPWEISLRRDLRDIAPDDGPRELNTYIKHARIYAKKRRRGKHQYDPGALREVVTELHRKYGRKTQ